jgi:hypothetical protein
MVNGSTRQCCISPITLSHFLQRAKRVHTVPHVDDMDREKVDLLFYLGSGELGSLSWIGMLQRCECVRE